MKKYRNEWKYYGSTNIMLLLQNRLIHVLKLDSHSNNEGKYCIRSLYFDSYKNICAKDNEAGVAKRYKWRIRYYEEFSGILRLEKKEKYFGLCHKKSCKITEEQYKEIVNGNAINVFWNTNEKLIKDFCIDIMTKLFEPKVIIEYERIAYIDNILNIRITLDTNISASYDIENFLTGNYLKIPLQDKDSFVLEIKFDNILPGYIKSIIDSYKYKRIAFSKYYIGRKKLEEVLR